MDSTNLDFLIKKMQTENEDFKLATKKGSLAQGTLDNYGTYLRTLDSLNNGLTLTWIKEAREKSVDENSEEYDRDITEIVGDTLESYFKGSPKIGIYEIDDVKAALKALTKCYLSIFDGVYAISMNNSISEEILAKMIAQTAIFVKPSIVEQFVTGNNGNAFASADNCEHQRKKPGQKKGDTIVVGGKTVKLDDNTTPNRLLKKAIIDGMGQFKIDWKQFKNYVVCHIWGEPYDNRTFCSLVNLVLIPKAIYGLSDHHPFIQKILQQKSVDLYSYIPGIKFPFNYLSNVSAPALSGDKIYQDLKWRNIYF